MAAIIIIMGREREGEREREREREEREEKRGVKNGGPISRAARRSRRREQICVWGQGGETIAGKRAGEQRGLARVSTTSVCVMCAWCQKIRDDGGMN